MGEILPVFDFDDTVVMGSTPMYNFCHQKGFESVGVTLYDGTIRELTESRWGATHEVHIRNILTNYPSIIPAKKYDVEDLTKKISDVYMYNLENVFAMAVHPLVGTVEELESLREQPALASGIHPDILPVVLKHAGIRADFFYPVVTAYDIPADKSKPDPYMLHKVLEETLQTTGKEYIPEEIAYVGDSVNDMKMAYAIGAKAIAVCTGRMERAEAEKLMKNNGGIIDYVRQDIRDVPRLINSLGEVAHTRAAS